MAVLKGYARHSHTQPEYCNCRKNRGAGFGKRENNYVHAACWREPSSNQPHQSVAKRRHRTFVVSNRAPKKYHESATMKKLVFQKQSLALISTVNKQNPCGSFFFLATVRTIEDMNRCRSLGIDGLGKGGSWFGVEMAWDLRMEVMTWLRIKAGNWRIELDPQWISYLNPPSNPKPTIFCGYLLAWYLLKQINRFQVSANWNLYICRGWSLAWSNWITAMLDGKQS